MAAWLIVIQSVFPLNWLWTVILLGSFLETIIFILHYINALIVLIMLMNLLVSLLKHRCYLCTLSENIFLKYHLKRRHVSVELHVSHPGCFRPALVNLLNLRCLVVTVAASPIND